MHWSMFLIVKVTNLSICLLGWDIIDIWPDKWIAIIYFYSNIFIVVCDYDPHPTQLKA